MCHTRVGFIDLFSVISPKMALNNCRLINNPSCMSMVRESFLLAFWLGKLSDTHLAEVMQRLLFEIVFSPRFSICWIMFQVSPMLIEVLVVLLLQEVLPPGTGSDAPDLFARALEYVANLCVLLPSRKSIEFEGGDHAASLSASGANSFESTFLPIESSLRV